MNEKTKKISLLIRQSINLVDSGAEVILYGSRARGEEHPGSDWDVLVLTDYPVNIDKEREFRDKIYDLELETEESFSVFVYSKNNWYTKQKITPFFQNVTHEGLRL
ncbi:MAG: nucleotidyltransferase domain-containing protein [Bacteroidales bacterium]